MFHFQTGGALHFPIILRFSIVHGYRPKNLSIARSPCRSVDCTQVMSVVQPAYTAVNKR